MSLWMPFFLVAQNDNCIIFNEHLNYTSCENKIIHNRMHFLSICLLFMQNSELDQSAIQASKQIAFESDEIRAALLYTTRYIRREIQLSGRYFIWYISREIQLSGGYFIWIMKLRLNPNQCSDLDSFEILNNSNSDYLYNAINLKDYQNLR